MEVKKWRCRCLRVSPISCLRSNGKIFFQNGISWHRADEGMSTSFHLHWNRVLQRSPSARALQNVSSPPVLISGVKSSQRFGLGMLACKFCFLTSCRFTSVFYKSCPIVTPADPPATFQTIMGHRKDKRDDPIHWICLPVASAPPLLFHHPEPSFLWRKSL